MSIFKLRVLAAILVTAAIATSGCGPTSTATATTTPESSAEQVIALIEGGQLDAARLGLRNLQPREHISVLQSAIESRANLARALVLQAKTSITQGDLSAGGRALAFALELDTGVESSDVAAEYDKRYAQISSAVERLRACASQRNFSCMREAVELIRHFDRYNSSAMFWELYTDDWRPPVTAQTTGERNSR